MKVDVKTLNKILEALSQKTGKSLDHGGLNEISEMIDGIEETYLYKKVYQKIRFSNDHELHGIRDFQLDAILKFLGFKSLNDFQNHISNPVSEQLMTLIGKYYSYVRANNPQSLVLRSPVRIYRQERSLVLELKGKDHTFKGEITEKNSCLFILMTSMEGKCFHHVYKIGNRRSPIVLQGIFSGISTALDPIGGRTLLIKQESLFESLTNRKEKTEVMISSGELEEARVGTYFRDYCNNNLSPFKSYDFGFDDLIPPTPDFSS